MPTEKGWAMPANARKAHYFVDGVSLCGGWGIISEPVWGGNQSGDDEIEPGTNDCKPCWRKWRKDAD